MAITKTLKWSRFERAATLLFEILFLITGFLHACSLTFGKSIISVFQWPAVLVGGVVLLMRLCSWRQYIKNRGLWILIAFAFSFLLSSVLSYSDLFYENIRSFIFLCFQFGILFVLPDGQEPEKRFGDLKILAILYLIFAFIISALGLVFLFTGYQKVIEPTSGPTICIGFVWGRLFGAWWDPNIGAVAACMAILIAVHFLHKTEKFVLWLLLLGSIAIQLLDIALSDSRSGQVALMAAAAVYSYFRFLKLFKPRISKRALRILLCLILSVLMALAAFEVVQLFKPSSGGLASNLPSIIPETILPEGETFGREQDLTNDISNRRFSIWESAVQIFLTKPFFGTSRAGIVPYAQRFLPDTYIVNNDHMIFSTMHNILFDVLVSQGGLGFVLFLAFALWWLIYTIKRGRAIFTSEKEAFALGIVAVTLITSMLMTEIVYVISPTSTMAWMALGYLVQKGKTGETNE